MNNIEFLGKFTGPPYDRPPQFLFNYLPLKTNFIKYMKPHPINILNITTHVKKSAIPTVFLSAEYHKRKIGNPIITLEILKNCRLDVIKERLRRYACYEIH